GTDHEIHLAGLIDIALLDASAEVPIPAGGHESVLVGIADDARWWFQTCRAQRTPRLHGWGREGTAHLGQRRRGQQRRHAWCEDRRRGPVELVSGGESLRVI